MDVELSGYAIGRNLEFSDDTSQRVGRKVERVNSLIVGILKPNLEIDARRQTSSTVFSRISHGAEFDGFARAVDSQIGHNVYAVMRIIVDIAVIVSIERQICAAVVVECGVAIDVITLGKAIVVHDIAETVGLL